MNPPSREGTTIAPTTSLDSLFGALTGRSFRAASHPDAVPEPGLSLPRRIDNPASATRVARDLLRSRPENATLVLHINDRHRFVGHAVFAVGWVQAARLLAHPVLLYAQACRATGSILVRYRRYGGSQRHGSRAGVPSRRRSMGPTGARCGGAPGGDHHGPQQLGARTKALI
jgi:hypothetical protein